MNGANYILKPYLRVIFTDDRKLPASGEDLVIFIHLGLFIPTYV